MVKRLPYVGQAIQETLDRIKGGIKTTLQGRQIFEQLGIPYFGPIDGHDVNALIDLFGVLKDADHPVLLHVQTTKGRGFTPALEDPCTFHSPRPFKVDGETASFSSRNERTFTAAFASALASQMRKDKRVIAITAAMPDGTGLAGLREEFGNRIIDVGIAESGAVDIAAGLAKTGMRPVVAIYSTFLQRGFDQIFQEVSLQNLPVVFCMDRAGLVGGDGAVHHGFCDISLLRTLPNMVLMAPRDEQELAGALGFALESDRPCVLRYPRDMVPQSHPEVSDAVNFELGRAAYLRQGNDGVIVAYGAVAREALQAAETLAADGIEFAVVSGRFAKPLDKQLFSEHLADDKNTPMVIVEDHALMGGFGSAVLEFAQENHLDTRRIYRLGISDSFVAHDSRQNQLAEVGIDRLGIVGKIRQILQMPTKEDSSKKATELDFRNA